MSLQGTHHLSGRCPAPLRGELFPEWSRRTFGLITLPPQLPLRGLTMKTGQGNGDFVGTVSFQEAFPGLPVRFELGHLILPYQNLIWHFS